MDREEKPSPSWLASSQATRLRRMAVKRRKASDRYFVAGNPAKGEDARREAVALEAGAALLVQEARRLQILTQTFSHNEHCAECGTENCWSKGTPSSGEFVNEVKQQGGGTMYLCLDCAKEPE